MIGKASDPVIETKAAVTKRLLYFVNDALAQYASCLAPDVYAKLYGGGKALAEYIRVMASHGRKLPESAVQDLNLYV